MDVKVTPLPGLGTQQEFTTHNGRRVGVISYRDGRLEMIVCGSEDPDKVSASVDLNSEESSALANLLGAPQLVNELTEQQREVTGVTTWQLRVLEGSPYDGGLLGETEMRTRTGTSIVAVVRDGDVHPSPRPDFQFVGGDLVVVVGTAKGLRAAAEILEGG